MSLKIKNCFLISDTSTAEVVWRIEINNDITSCAAQNKNQQIKTVTVCVRVLRAAEGWEAELRLEMRIKKSKNTRLLRQRHSSQRLLLTVCVWPQTAVWGITISVWNTMCAGNRSGSTTAALHSSEEKDTHLHTNMVPQHNTHLRNTCARTSLVRVKRAGWIQRNVLWIHAFKSRRDTLKATGDEKHG